MRKLYNGLDLLKFVMALIVVMIHVKPNGHSNLLSHVFQPLQSISVPVFFVISSVLLFNKLNRRGYSDVLKYIKRIGILYLCWLLIDAWFIIARKPYFELGLFQGSVEFIKDLIFGTTFPGSWYLSASVVGVLIVYSLSRILNRYHIFVITFLVAQYVYCVKFLPEVMQIPYEWYATHLREEVSLSFPAQMVWISIGQILSYCLVNLENCRKILRPLSVSVFILAFFAQVFYPSLVIKIIMVVSLFAFCFLIKLPDSQVYKRLRNYSILMFFFHFSIAGKMEIFCRYCGDTLFTNWLYYLLVVAISIAFAEIVLRLENNKYLNFLKYTH